MGRPPSCSCLCGGIFLSTVTDCDVCDGGASECWELTVAGVTDSNCSNCASEYNGVFTIKHLGFTEPQVLACRWGSVESITNDCFGSQPGDKTWIMDIGVSTVTLTPAHGFGLGNYFYSMTTGDFSCTGSNTFDLQVSVPTGECGDWPSTLTIEPVACP